MNRTYKVIYNRTRHLYQVVSELAKSRGKSDSLVTVATAADKHLRRAVVMALLAMSVSVPIAGIQAADGTTDGTADPTLQEQITQNKTAISKNATDISTNKTAIAANTANITTNTEKIGSLDANGNYIKAANSVSSNLSTLDTQVKSNADAISKETTDRETAVSTEQAARTNADTELGNKITGNATDITHLKDLSNITTAGKTVIKKQAKQAVKVAATGNATVTTTGAEDDGSPLTYTINVGNNGAISVGDTNLVSGGTLYTELRPDANGTYYYISNTNTTAQNLINLDATLNKALAALDIDMTDSSAYTSKLSKYFKVNPEETTSDDGKTKTYAPDAAANGTNSVAIGPSAQAGEKTTDTTTSTTTVTGGTSSAAIGDSAVANGNTSVALGADAQVLNTTDHDGKTTATITGSTAVGSGAKVNGATDATAIGTSAQVNETATGGIAFGKNAVTGEDKGTVTVGDVTANVAAVGGENSVALGTDAKASGNTALALGKGAQVNNYTTQSGTTVTKTVNSGSTAVGSGAVVTGANDAVAFGSGAKVEGTGTNSDDSMAIGKSASVATAKDAMAIGTSASVASGADNAIALGNTAKANTSNTTAIGYNASATGAGAVAIGENTSTSTEGGISIGSGTSVSGRSIAIGYATDANGNTVKTESQNTDAVAIGNGAQANANDSISIGHQAGKDTNEGRTSGYGSLIAIGTNAGGNVKGMQNVALGSGAGSNVKSSYNVAIGSNAGSGINYAAAADSNPQDGYNISIGYEANYQSADANAKNIKESIAIGHSANAVSEATALGTGATASGNKSMALGYSATAADTDSIALGDKASAAGGNIAIGSGSQAPAVTSYDKGYLTGSSSVNGYISVGGATSATGTTVLRRISNVADGAADQDAVTVAQLKAAYTDLEGTIKTTDTKISDTYTQSAIDSKISTVESKITASQTKYFSINPSSDTLTANVNNDGASTTGAADAMAIGPNATATSAKAVAIGNNVSASGKGSIALGTADNPATTGKVDAGNNTSANPHVTSAEGANSVAIGTSAIAQTDNSVALGTRASVYTSNVTNPATNTTVKVGQQSIAIGYEAETRNSNATSIGSGAKAYSNGSTAVGHGAYAQGADSVVIGTSSTANGASSGIVGKSNTINGSNTYAVGSENNVNGNWGAVTYSGLYGSKNTVTPVADTSNSTKHAMDSLSITGNSNTISQGSYSDTVQNISILGNSNSVTGASSDAANAGTTANITVIGGSNTVTGRDGAGSDYMGKTWNQLTRTTVIGYGNKVNQAASTTSLADTQILGNDVTATLGNSVYLGTGSAAKNANSPDTDTLTEAETDAANAVDTTGMTDDQKTTALSNAKAKARYAVKLAAMKANNGSTAGTEVLSTDTTYDDGTSYTYAGTSPAGVVTIGSAGKERRIQNVAAGLVSATSTDAVNGSQLYALTRQLRFGGDNSSFGTTAADDKNVVARGSNEALSIIGGEKDSAKLTDNNIGVMADNTNNTLTVKLSKNVNLGNDGSVVTGNTTLDNSGLTITGGPKFTSSGIDAASQKINNVTAGTADTDAANVGQVNAAAAEATTEVKAGTNASLGTVETNATDKHKIYTVNVDNLAVKANGTGNATVTLKNGINFTNGTNTTAAVGTDGSVTISATHNKLSTVSAATGDKDNVTLTLTDADGNTVTSTGLKNTYTTVTKDGKAHTVTFARNDGTTQTLSLGDLDGASKGELTTVAAKATSEVTNGTNVSSVTKSAGSNGQNIYTVNVDDLAVKTTSGEKKSVHLADGLVFADGTNTTATVGDNGTIKFNVSDAAIRKQAVQAITVQSGSNVTVTPETNADGTLKTFTVAASDLKYSANGTSRTTSLANGISFAAGSNTTAEIDNNGAIKINATHNKLNATGSVTKATADSNAVTLTLQDADGNTTTAGLTDTYTTVSKDADNKKVTFKRNDGETQTLELSDLGGITAAQDKYVTSGTVTYDANGNGTAALTGNNGLTASITGLKDTKVSSGTVNYVGTQGDASGSATLTMNDGSTATITGLKDDYITRASVGTETNHVTMTRLGGGTVDLNLNPILEKYSLSDYRLVGNGDSQDQAYQVNADGTVTLNVVDAKNAANKKTIQITGLASQSGVNAGRTTVKSSDSSITVSDSTSNSDTHTYDIKVDYSKIPGHVSLAYTGDTGNGSNTLDHAVKFAGTANQVTTTATNGQVTFALASDIKGINSVTAGNTTLNTNGVTNGNMSLTSTGLTVANTDASKQVSLTASGVSMGSQRVQNVADATGDTDAATLGQVKNARTKVAAGSNVAGVGSSEDTATHQMTYTVNVDNLSVKANDGTAKEVALKTGLNFKNGNNTTAVVGDNGEVKYDLNPALTGLTSVTAGNSTLDTNGLTIKEGTATKVAITNGNVTMGGNVIHNVGAGTETTDAVNKGQLDALQNQVSGGWNLSGKNAEGTAVTARIGAGKTVTYTDGAYTKSVVTKDDNDNATVKVDVTTGTLTVGADGKIASANGLATTGDVANAVNNASWTIQDGNKPENAQQVKAGDTVSFKAGDNLSLEQNGKAFTYKLNQKLTNMTSVTAVGDKNNTAVLDGEGLKVTDQEGNSLTQHATEIRLHDGTKAATDTATDVVLNKQGLQNGGHTITGVADGTIGENSQDAINGSQFYKLQQTVTNGGWNITGEDTTKSTHIGNDKTVSFKNGTNTTVAVDGSDTGVDVKVNVNTTAISTDADHKATASGNGLATASDVASAINNAAWNVKKNGGTAQQVKAGDTVTFDAGDNIVLKQSGMSFTYGLASDVNINSIRLGGTKDGKGNWAGGIYIGEQAGSGANLAKGFYITGLSNTKWDRAAISENSSMAATEGQLKQAIENITKSGDGTGGFGLMADSGAPIMQDLRKTIQVKGDGEGTADGNIKTSNENGVLRIRLNKQLNLTDQGSVTIGSSQVSDGSIVLDNTDAAKKITLNSNEGTASIGGVTVNGAAKTVSGLSNTEWNVETAAADGYKGSNKAATESQLQTVYNQATKTASENELHTLAKEGGYTVDDNHQVSMDVVNGKGEKKNSIVINDVAKASEVGTVSEIAKDLQNKAGDTLKPTSVVEAINNLNSKVDNKVGNQNYLKVEGKEIANGDNTTTAIGKLNNRMNDIYQTAGQHTTVSNTDKNLDIKPTTDEKGKTNYEINLSKQVNLGDVKLDGDKGSIEAKSIKADSFTSGSTVVNNDGVQVGKGTALTSDSLKVGSKTYISSDGLNANSQKITNVQAGEADTDAANVGQVRAADEQLAAGINQNAYGIQQLDHAVNKLDSRINRVGAGAAALAALHPGSYDPEDKWDFSAAFGHYHDANAAALGIYYHPNETTILSIGGSMGDGENMVNAGITWKMGRGGHHVQPVQKSPVVSVPSSPKVQPAEPVSVSPVPQESKPVPAAMPSRLPDSEKTVDTATLAQILSKQTEILEKLAQNQAAPVNRQAVSGDDIFPDVPEHHWAYVFAEKLEKAGLLKGYTGTGALTSPVLTRNDFANILYTALKNGATTNPLFNKDDSLNRMAAEFKEELKQVK